MEVENRKYCGVRVPKRGWRTGEDELWEKTKKEETTI